MHSAPLFFNATGGKEGRTHYNLVRHPKMKIPNQILMDKHPDEELYTINQKYLQKVVVKSLHYEQAIDSTILMALNYLAAFKTKPTIETAKNITHFLNRCASHPGVVM